MSRHRIVRNDNYDDYDEYEEFGRSYDDDNNFCVSPNTASQFMYKRDDSSKSLNLPPTVMEEEMQPEDEEMTAPAVPVVVDQGKFLACVDYIESCAGDAFTRSELQGAVLSANYNAELALQFLLEGNIPPGAAAASSVSSAKPPLPLLTKKLESLSVSSNDSHIVQTGENHGENGTKRTHDGAIVRIVAADQDPSLSSSDNLRKRTLPAVKLPDWANSFLSSVNQYNATVAQTIPGFLGSQREDRTKLPDLAVNKERPTNLGLPRPESTPDFKNLTLDRSASSTPTIGSPKSSRKGSKDRGISPALTPIPGSPKSQRKGSKDKQPSAKNQKGDDVVGESGTTTTEIAVSRTKLTAKTTALYEERQASSKPLINLIVIGHVDAGKSTLMGHLLFLLGRVDSRQMAKFEHEAKKIGKSSFMFAWVLDETGEERSRGVTIDVAQTSFETTHRLINLMDAPGHKDFIPNMITGAAQADVAILVVDATTGEFETGFEAGGQTREHTLLARSLGVTQLVVVVNKMDNVQWAQDRFDYIMTTLKKFLKATGFKDADVSFVPCSGFTGENLITQPKNVTAAKWWSGPTLLDQINDFRPPVRQIDKTYRQVITDVFKSASGGFCVAGKVESGHLQVGDKIVVMPAGAQGIVKGIMLDSGACNNAFAGDNAILTFSGVDILNVHVGDVVCDPSNPVPVANRIRARIALFTPKVPLLAGQQCVFHNQSYTESCTIKKLLTQINRNTGEVEKKNPRVLTKNTSGEVEILLQRPVCAELYSVSKELGRFMLRDSGSTIAAGVIVEIIS